MNSQKDLRAAYDQSVKYIDYLRERNLLADKREVSEFWANEFRSAERINYPSFDEILQMRRGATFPLGDFARIDEATEQRFAEAAFRVFGPLLPAGFLGALPESDLGQPRKFSLGDAQVSAGAVANAVTVFKILDWIRKQNLGQRPLRILEIGAGYGQVAYQLCMLANVRSYTIIDLPENLFLSSYYLQASFPGKSVEFVQNELENQSAYDPELRFLVPSMAPALDDEFDLIINSYSFQEMPRASVERYFALAKSTLSKDGIFYSLNSHGKTDVERARDYPTEQFRWLGLKAVRPYPQHFFFASTPYEVVLGQPAGRNADQGKKYFDALAALMQLGLGNHVSELCDCYVAGTLTDGELAALDLVESFFNAPNAGEKVMVADAIATDVQMRPIAEYLKGLVCFAQNDRKSAVALLTACRPVFAGSFAETRIVLILAACGQSKSGDWESVARIVPHLEAEMSKLSKTPNDIRRNVSREIGLRFSESFVRRLTKRLRAVVSERS